MENSIKVIRQIERTHKGLGIPILFGNLAVLAKSSVMFVGEKGIGKSTIVKAIKPINVLSNLDMSMDTVTMQELAMNIGYCHNANMLWRLKDWGTLTEWHRKMFLTIGSQIISDHEYKHMMGKPEKPLPIDIKDTDLTVLIGITPIKIGKMMRENENWEAMASDRFIKICMINPLRHESTKYLPAYHIDETIKPYPLQVNTNYGLTKKQISELQKVVEEREHESAKAWRKHFKA